MSDKWIAYTDYDQVEAFATEAEAVAWAEGQIDGYLADGTWDEGVESIIVARLTHAIVKTVLGVKAEMTADAWDELTHSNQDADEWWRFDLKPIEEQSHE